MSLSSPATSPMSPGPPGSLSFGEEVIFESYLHKTPPLDRLFVSWKKRWFTLSRTDPNDPASLDLTYYMDKTKREKRGFINLAKFVGIRPNAKVGNKENVFAIETEDRKYVLRASDANTKCIWLAKLCELCGQEPVYHVTVPHQPSAVYSEAILKLSSPTHITVIAPSMGNSIMEIAYKKIRRMGSLYTHGTDVVWFETCQNSTAEEFRFFIIASGGEVAHHIVTQELKTAIECCTGSLLILEDTIRTEIAYISREHYGCQEFPQAARIRMLQAGMRSLPSLWRPFNFEHQERRRRISEPAVRVATTPNGGISLEEVAINQVRRRTEALLPPFSQAKKQTLGQFYQASLSSSSQNSLDMADSSDPGDVFDSLPHPPALRQLSHSSNSSHSQDGSGVSLPYSPTIAEEDPFGILENDHSVSGVRRPSAPIVPPRSLVSLQQGVYYGKKTSTPH